MKNSRLIVFLLVVAIATIDAKKEEEEGDDEADPNATAWSDEIVTLLESQKFVADNMKGDTIIQMDSEFPESIQQHRGENQILVQPMFDDGRDLWWSADQLNLNSKFGAEEEECRVDEVVVCERKIGPSRLAIVIPSRPSTYAAIQSNLISWAHPQYSPCSFAKNNNNNHNNPKPQPTDLVFYSPRKELLGGLRQLMKSTIASIPQLKKLFEPGDSKCFASVRFLTADLTIEEDITSISSEDVRTTKLSQVAMFEKLFDNKEFNTSYSHFFWMNQDVRPIRPNWLQSLLVESFTSRNAWMVGSVARDIKPRPCQMRRSELERINENALYRVNRWVFRFRI